MNDYMFLIPIGFFVFIIFVYFILNKLRDNPKYNKDFTKRLEKVSGDEIVEKIELILHRNKVFDEDTKKTFKDKIEANLIRADINYSVSNFIMLSIAIGIALGVICVMFFSSPIYFPIGFFLSFMFLKFYIDSRTTKYIDSFEKDWIKVLRRMSAVLRTSSVELAIKDCLMITNISESTKLIIGEILHYMKFGDSIEDALYKVAKRLSNEYLLFTAITIDIGKEAGANLSVSLDRISSKILDDRLTKKEQKSIIATSSGTAKLLSVIPPLLSIYMINQNSEVYAEYIKNPAGLFILIVLFGLMGIGIYICNRMSKFK